MHPSDHYGPGLDCETCDCIVDPLDADESGTPRCHLCGIAFSIEATPAHRRTSLVG